MIGRHAMGALNRSWLAGQCGRGRLSAAAAGSGPAAAVDDAAEQGERRAESNGNANSERFVRRSIVQSAPKDGNVAAVHKSDMAGITTSERPAGDYFDTSHLKGDFKAKCIRGSVVTTVGQGTQFILQTASTVLLARLLTPRDYGLVAMVTAITGFMATFKDLGLSAATIQKAETNHAQISTLFWINIAISLTILAVTAGLAPAIAWFYGEPRLVWITLALSLAFLFTGLTIQHQALLRRQMRFTAVAAIDVLSMFAGVAVGVTMALSGAAYWSLVGMQLGTAVTNALAVWLVCGWRPGLPVRGAGVRSMLHFGLDVTGFHVVHYFLRNADKILLGRFHGTHVLGLYSRAYSLFMLPITQIRAPLTAVAMPALSRVQNEPADYARYYYSYVSVLAFITMPLSAFLFVCSRNIILLLLGPQWIEADAVFRIMAIAGFIQAVETTRGLVLLSLGHSRRFFVWGVMASVYFVCTYVIGLPWGARGVATAYAIGDYLLVLPSLWWCFRQTPVSVAGFLRAVQWPAAASLVAAAAMLLIHRYALAGGANAVVIAGTLAVGAASYLGAWAVMPRGTETLRQFLSYASLIFSRKPRGAVEASR